MWLLLTLTLFLPNFPSSYQVLNDSPCWLYLKQRPRRPRSFSFFHMLHPTPENSLVYLQSDHLFLNKSIQILQPQDGLLLGLPYSGFFSFLPQRINCLKLPEISLDLTAVATAHQWESACNHSARNYCAPRSGVASAVKAILFLDINTLCR